MADEEAEHVYDAGWKISGLEWTCISVFLSRAEFLVCATLCRHIANCIVFPFPQLKLLTLPLAETLQSPWPISVDRCTRIQYRYPWVEKLVCVPGYAQPNTIDALARLATCLPLFTKLVTLDLRHCRAEDQGVAAVCDSLGPDTTPGLRSLCLRGNNVGSAGGGGKACPALGAMLSRFANLRHLDVGDNVIGAFGVACIAAGLLPPPVPTLGGGKSAGPGTTDATDAADAADVTAEGWMLKGSPKEKSVKRQLQQLTVQQHREQDTSPLHTSPPQTSSTAASSVATMPSLSGTDAGTDVASTSPSRTDDPTTPPPAPRCTRRLETLVLDGNAIGLDGVREVAKIVAGGGVSRLRIGNNRMCGPGLEALIMALRSCEQLLVDADDDDDAQNRSRSTVTSDAGGAAKESSRRDSKMGGGAGGGGGAGRGGDMGGGGGEMDDVGSLVELDMSSSHDRPCRGRSNGRPESKFGTWGENGADALSDVLLGCPLMRRRIQVLRVANNNITPFGIALIAALLPRCGRLVEVDLSVTAGGLKETTAALLGTCLAACPELERVWLCNVLDARPTDGPDADLVRELIDSAFESFDGMPPELPMTGTGEEEARGSRDAALLALLRGLAAPVLPRAVRPLHTNVRMLALCNNGLGASSALTLCRALPGLPLLEALHLDGCPDPSST